MATRSAKIDQKADLIWAIADKLTGVYKPHEYGDVILPLTVLIKVEAELQSFIMVPHFLQEMQEADLLKSEDIFLKMICLRQSLLYRMIFSITQELQPISGYCQIKRQVQSEKEKCS